MMENRKGQEPTNQELLERIKALEYHLGIQQGLPVFPLSIELDKIRNGNLMEEVTVKFERTHPDAVLPTIAYQGDACFDLMAVEDTVIPPSVVVESVVNAETAQQILASGGEVIISDDHGTMVFNLASSEGAGYLSLEDFLNQYPLVKNANSIKARTVHVGKAFVPVGLKMELPEGWEATFRTRSGMGVKRKMRVHPGTIDAGYRGDLAVAVYNMGSTPELIKKGTGVAQVAIRPVPKVNIVEGTVELNSQRGEKGFGSSDKV